MEPYSSPHSRRSKRDGRRLNGCWRPISCARVWSDDGTVPQPPSPTRELRTPRGLRSLRQTVSHSCVANAPPQILPDQLLFCFRRRHLGRESPHLAGKLYSAFGRQNVTRCLLLSLALERGVDAISYQPTSLIAAIASPFQCDLGLDSEYKSFSRPKIWYLNRHQREPLGLRSR